MVNEKISFMEVKALYDEAYEEKNKANASLTRFGSLLRQAEILAAAYMRQLEVAASSQCEKAA